MDADTVLTCFPGSWPDITGQDDFVSTDIFPSLLRYIQDAEKRRWIRNAEELAYCIVDRCAANVFDSDLQSNEKLDFMGMFQTSISELVRDLL